MAKTILYVLCKKVDYPTVQTLAVDHRNDVISNTLAIICGYIGTYCVMVIIMLPFEGSNTISCVLCSKYKEENNDPSSVNQISLAIIMTKPGINVAPRQHEHLGKPKCVNRYPGRVKFTCCGYALAVVESRE